MVEQERLRLSTDPVIEPWGCIEEERDSDDEDSVKTESNDEK